MKSRFSLFLTLLFVTLPNTLLDSWFPSYDLLAALPLMLGFGFLVLAFQTREGGVGFQFLSGLLFGLSAMVRLSSLIPVSFALLALFFSVIRRQQPARAFLANGLGFAAFPALLFAAGYNPLLTVLTSAIYVRQEEAYHVDSLATLLRRLPVVFYLGIPLLVLIGQGLVRRARGLTRNVAGTLVAPLLVTAVFFAVLTGLDPDFHRLMLGVSACFVLVLSLLDDVPVSPRIQAACIGFNLAFVLLTTIL